MCFSRMHLLSLLFSVIENIQEYPDRCNMLALHQERATITFPACYAILMQSKYAVGGQASEDEMVSEQGITSSQPGKRRVAVIGAGASGLAVAKCLLDEGLEPIVYEQSPQIGGLWNYDETLPDGGGVMYRSLRTNTSKHTLAFSDFPMPKTAPDFPSHSEVLQYLLDFERNL